MQPKSGVFMAKIKIKLEISPEKSDKIHDIDSNIRDINVKISCIDIKILNTAADHQSKNLGKLFPDPLKISTT